MGAQEAKPLTIEIGEGQSVSGLLRLPPDPVACLVLAHGAGAGMRHPFLEAVARALAARRIGTLRYQFRYMERGSRSPDPPKVAQAVVRAAVAAAAGSAAGVPLFAGGKSFGARMTSQAQAETPLPGVRGLVFLGFPLHAPGRPSDERGRHLLEVKVPMLFLQGTRDTFAELPLLRGLVDRLGQRATLELIDDGDHSFHVPARGGRKDSEVLDSMMDVAAAWIESRVV